MPIKTALRTDRFLLQYDDAIAAASIAAQTLAIDIERDFARMRLYLPFDQNVSPDEFERYPTVVIFVDITTAATLGTDPSFMPQRGGGRNTARYPGHAGTIFINVFGATNQPITPDFARFIFMAEMSEQLMGLFGWVANKARGEALSRILAEEFQPAAGYALECVSLAPWVNAWLNSSPRFDYINNNPEPTAANTFLGTDTDEPGYGCGMLFINYLRYQLNYSLQAICQAGGVTFADAYKNLTGRTDDPFIAMTTLLDRHFHGSYQLSNNNPFPLLARSDRTIDLAGTTTTKRVPSLILHEPRIAHVKPFVTCPPGDYHYTEHLQAQTWVVTATPSGFGVPQYQWSVNGEYLGSTSGTITVPSEFTIPNPDAPNAPSHKSGSASFSWNVVNLPGSLESVLTITNESTQGDYPITIGVDVSEVFSKDSANHAQTTLEFNGVAIIYEAKYYADAVKCAAQFTQAVPNLQQVFVINPPLPDPPYPGERDLVLKMVDEVRAELARIAQNDEKLAHEGLIYAAGRLQISPQILGVATALPAVR